MTSCDFVQHENVKLKNRGSMEIFYEILILLKKLRLFVRLDKNQKIQIQKVSVNSRTLKLTDFEIELPCYIVPSSVQIRKTQSGLEVTASVDHGWMKSHSHQESFSLGKEKSFMRLSAKEVRSLVDLQCHTCQVSLLRRTKGTASQEQKDIVSEHLNTKSDELDALTNDLKSMKLNTPHFQSNSVMDLPSDYWHEMVDCWMCHQEDYAQIQNSHRSGVVRSRPGCLMVGRNHLIVDKSDLDMEIISLNNGLGIREDGNAVVDEQTTHNHKRETVKVNIYFKYF